MTGTRLGFLKMHQFMLKIKREKAGKYRVEFKSGRVYMTHLKSTY